MMSTQYGNKDLHRGAFFIVDHFKPRPSHSSDRTLQNRAIEAHLARHTYTWSPAESNDSLTLTSPIDVAGMCEVYNRMSRFIDEDTHARSTYWTPPNGDLADAIFREGTRHLPPEVLTSYGYNVSTFEEGQLPSPTAQLALPSQQLAGSQEQFKHAQRTFWIVIQDIEATRHFSKHEDYKYRGSQRSIDALRTLIDSFKLQKKNKAGKICLCNGKDLRNALQTAWAKHGNWSKRVDDESNRPTLWNAGRQDWQPRYIRLINDVCDNVTRRDSLVTYDPATANPFIIRPDDNGEDGVDSDYVSKPATVHGEGSMVVCAKLARDIGIELDKFVARSTAVSPVVAINPSTPPSISVLEGPTCEKISGVSLHTHHPTDNDSS
jgi:hypothetical protein